MACLDGYAVRTVSGGNDKSLYIIGDAARPEFSGSPVPSVRDEGAAYKNWSRRVYRALTDGKRNKPTNPNGLRPLIEQVQKKPQKTVETIKLEREPASAELSTRSDAGAKYEVLAVLLVGSSRKELVLLTQRIVTIAALVAGAADSGGFCW